MTFAARYDQMMTHLDLAKKFNSLFKTAQTAEEKEIWRAKEKAHRSNSQRLKSDLVDTKRLVQSVLAEFRTQNAAGLTYEIL